MAPIRRRMAIAGSVALASVALLAQPVAAVHSGAIVDCGSAGTFTLKTATTGAGLFPPSFFDVIVFEEHGTLTLLELSINGELAAINDRLLFDLADVGRLHWNAGEATCSFTLANGDFVEATGVLTAN